MTMQELRIPDIGDAEDVEVIEICVAVGDEVAIDDALIVIESDKASMEVPAAIAGIVRNIHVTLGDLVDEGDLIVSIDAPMTIEAQADEPEDSTAEHDAGSKQDTSGSEPANSDSKLHTSDPLPDSGPKPDSTERFEVRVPDIGEAEDVVVIEVAVTDGQAVDVDDLLVVVESDKASMEIPAPFAGTVVRVAVAEGDEVVEGTLLVVIEGAVARVETVEQAGPGEVAPSEAAASAPVAVPSIPVQVVAEADAGDPGAGASVYAGPAVRRLARELGVDLALVKGSSASGRIVKDDVKTFVKSALQARATPGAGVGGGIPAVAEIDFSRFGGVETVPLSRIRVRGADNLYRSWLNVVHVTQHDEADVTDLEAFRKSMAPESETQGIRLTPVPFIMKACCLNLAAFPRFNASLDKAVKNLILKRYFNIGFAVDTEDGLVVPVVRDVDKKGIWELAAEIAELSTLARERKLKPDSMQGGCFTISSLGAIGGTGFTPIVNAPEVAILGVARLATKPVFNGSEFEPRSMLPLSLSYDHRAVNGAEAGRFVVALCALLGDVRRFVL